MYDCQNNCFEKKFKKHICCTEWDKNAACICTVEWFWIALKFPKKDSFLTGKYFDFQTASGLS